ncbi:MAG: hypothetical protein ABIR15_04295 [Chitinophagaceae bacterium]
MSAIYHVKKFAATLSAKLFGTSSHQQNKDNQLTNGKRATKDGAVRFIKKNEKPQQQQRLSDYTIF